MAGSTITTTIGIGVTLGSAPYPTPLTITDTAAIAPVFPGVVALYSDISAGYALNLGLIVGGSGSAGANGVFFPESPPGNGGNGGNGVDIVAGSVTNQGSIRGGSGGNGGDPAAGVTFESGGSGGNGGVGVVLTSGALFNQGTITGGEAGAGGTGFIDGSDGSGGVGVFLPDGGTLTNAGYIAGGSGDGGIAAAVSFGSGPARLILEPGATFSGAVVASPAYSNVLELASASTVGVLRGWADGEYQNFATLDLDTGAGWQLPSGLSVAAPGGTVTGSGALYNDGAIQAAAGQAATSAGEVGGAGHNALVVLSGALINQGAILGGSGGGGAAGGFGGYGVSLGITLLAGSVTNRGKILGGAGGAGAASQVNGPYGGVGGTGGVGAALWDGSLTNLGLIVGGQGGAGGGGPYGVGGNGGAGGAGVFVAFGKLTNAGEIVGGLGGVGGAGLVSTAGAGVGGVGVSLPAGGTLANEGTIAGGYNGDDSGMGDAVLFGTGASRLVVYPYAAFAGTVVANAAYSNVLELAAAYGQIRLPGPAASNPLGFLYGGIGSEYRGFGTVVVDPGANWSLGGSNTIAAGASMSVAGYVLVDVGLLVAGSLTNTGTILGASRVDGVDVAAGGRVTNAGTIIGGLGDGFGHGGVRNGGVGVAFDDGGTLVETGSVSGGYGANGTADAVSFGFGPGALILAPGAVINGDVVANAAFSNTLELTSAGGVGTLSGGIGVKYQGFGGVIVDVGASWLLTGNNEIASGTSLVGLGDLLQISGSGAAVAVSGAGALLENVGELQVGGAAPGALSIEGGAHAVTVLGTFANSAVIANTAGASGSSVDVGGAGSDWQVGGTLVVGNAGAASLDITAGGTVSAGALNAAASSGSDGVISISGDNSSLITAGTLSVGTGGAGELSILSGANVNIGGDFDIGTSSGASGNVDIEDTSGTVFVGGNLNLGVNGGVAVLTVGYGSTLEVDNGGVNGGPNAVLIPFSPIDPFYSNGVTYPISSTQVQSFPAYVADSRFNLSQGVTYTLETPAIYAGSGFEIGAGTSDTEPTELVLNTGSFSANSSVAFESAVGTLVVGVNALATIEMPISGTSSFTKVVNPDAGVPLIGSFDGTLKQFQAGDVIIVDTSVVATFSQSGSLVAVIANGTTLGALTFDSVGAATAATSSGLENEVVAAPCFAAGTRIATARGEVAVEDLAVGDLVPVVLGDAPEPIVWIGQRTVNCARHPKPAQMWPVRIAAGAFGVGQPHTDLWLSPDHAVYVNYVLIPVKHLINGTTIAQVKVNTVTYYHLELPRHDIVLAEGLAAESYLDMQDGSNYANRPGPIRLHPDFSTRMWDAYGCAPLIVTGPALAAVRTLVSEYAGEHRTAA